ncbi:MAG: Ig-like domain-containing protein, partial [Lachnospiraceae bacterium]|nr:Ig-like domain-containing protein [Lachnospiraceae bacterium]
TAQVWYGDDCRTMDISWKCEEDYDKDLDSYHFIPYIEGESFAEDADLPRLTVTYEKEFKKPPLMKLDKNMEGPAYDLTVTEAVGDSGEAADLPKKYDGFAQKLLPVVRNQDPYGTCWTFSVMACLEADLIHDKKATTDVDLSELHMAYYAVNKYDDPKGCRKDYAYVDAPSGNHLEGYNYGGFGTTGMRLLSNSIGAVKESDAPYASAETFDPDISYLRSRDVFRMDKAYVYNNTDITGIKKAILEHGAVATAYVDSDLCYSATYNSYYDPFGWDIIAKDPGAGAHAIAVVGWDDDFPADHFAEVGHPQKNGAWLIRNSWGINDYNRSGYFWMSYYDKGLIERTGYYGISTAFDAEKERYKNTYAYDGYAYQDQVWNIKGGFATLKTDFNVDGGEKVRAIGFETLTGNVDAQVTVKNNKTWDVRTGSIHCDEPGFYTIKLDKALKVPNKADVDVTLELTRKDKGKIDVVGEFILNGHEVAGDKVAFHTECDRGFTCNGKKMGGDPRIKLYTVNYTPAKEVKVKSISLNKEKLELKKGDSKKLKFKIKPSNATFKNVKWSSSNKKVATVSDEGRVKAKKAGTARITVKTSNGKKDTCTVKVKKK